MQNVRIVPPSHFEQAEFRQIVFYKSRLLMFVEFNAQSIIIRAQFQAILELMCMQIQKF